MNESTNTDFDINKVAAEFVSLNLKEIFELSADVYMGAKKGMQQKLKTIYKGYLMNVMESQKHSS
ncbi:hypothetical protein [Carboxylicivirga sp. M1479]|uniref:hypothetical protein n=1 Tax=Carboxylicivirga sp. M1479 TaxID=2594476 RepID=UPI001178C2A6|nr:hypothetical protein [Carboxylicivirga sp. M1479]TRX72589.1 hypothetical protein FNN09_01230 [Carboxylicivirga sp. M1479]